MPTPITVIPNAITSFAEPFVTSSWETPANSIEVIPAAAHAKPPCKAEKPSTCCMYRVPMKMNE
jgi:hypothetical protein